MLKENQRGMCNQTFPVVEKANSMLHWLNSHHLICIHKHLDSYTRETKGSFLSQGYNQTNKIAS